MIKITPLDSTLQILQGTSHPHEQKKVSTKRDLTKPSSIQSKRTCCTTFWLAPFRLIAKLFKWLFCCTDKKSDSENANQPKKSTTNRQTPIKTGTQEELAAYFQNDITDFNTLIQSNQNEKTIKKKRSVSWDTKIETIWGTRSSSQEKLPNG